eukprot:TRINITY_DN8580_c0_g1_i1.p1 TRINITY_DN8580_c0_g1~~TRINITY_DN8580_c0_g1_i1.p1  ORF type:complete len:300 (-),score=42.11 TRINITY_DN8580_c0_g1_i1:89-988(-)
MSNSTRVFVGRLSHRTHQRDLEDLFAKHGKITNFTMKQGFAFVEYEDSRDAEDAVKTLHNHNLDGAPIAVEFSHGGRGSRDSRSSSGRRHSSRSRYSPPRNSDFRIQVEGLPYDAGWQDLKDHFRQTGEVCFTDVIRDRGGKTRGIVEFKYYEDMKEAVRMEKTRIRGTTVYIYEDYKGGRRRSRSRDRSRSPRKRSRSRTPKRRTSRSRSGARRSKSRSRSVSPRKARSPSRSPLRRSPSKSPPNNNNGLSKRRSRSPKRSPSPKKSKRSPSKSPRRSRSPVASRKSKSLSPRRSSSR